MTRPALALLVLVLAVAGVGCPCSGVVNSSPELRWWLFSNFGASKICPEMLKRGVPLKMAQSGEASIGRFFPSQCHVTVDDAKKAIVMNAAGTGYVVMPFTRRVGFSVAMGVEYHPDFRLEDDATYVWGKFSHFTQQPDMRVLGVENPIVNLATQTPFGNVASVIGNGLVQSEIGKGFTVVRQEDGDDFALGHLEPPAKPKRQFKPGKGHVLLANDLTNVASQSREFLGPLFVEDDRVSLFFRASVTGPQLTYVVVERSVGEAWRRAYETAQPLAPPPGVVLGGGQLAQDTRLAIPVPKGVYYVVVENSAPAPILGVGDMASLLSYSIELGDR
ncbi:MAG: hypothetical protein KIT84_12605 [Labilithrix sp.]|nr:hypothetical protein [Labilithrix sp.]MCW5811855.1 hypothetical protein [Labilithrix sp.]